MPSANGICLTISSTPIAASMPLMTDDGTYAAKRPARSIPNTNCSTPDSSTASRNAEKLPSCAMPSTTITTRPAAGPLTDSDDDAADDARHQSGERFDAGGVRDAEAERQRDEEYDNAGDDVARHGGET